LSYWGGISPLSKDSGAVSSQKRLKIMVGRRRNIISITEITLQILKIQRRRGTEMI